MNIKFLETTVANSAGDIVHIDYETDSDVYYYDGWDRWSYLPKDLEGIAFEYVDELPDKLKPRVWVRITSDGRTCWYMKRYRLGPITPIKGELAEEMLESGEAIEAFNNSRPSARENWE